MDRVLTLIIAMVMGFAATAREYAPRALAPREDGHVFVACAKALVVVDIRSGRVLKHHPLPEQALGLTLTRDGQRLFVTCGGSSAGVVELDATTGRILRLVQTGHTPMAPVLSTDERLLFICERFENKVIALDLQSGKEVAHMLVIREPVAAALCPQTDLLIVANHLPHGRADAAEVAAAVSVIDTRKMEVAKHIRLRNGSGLLRGICVSPDSRYACVTHTFARHQLPTFLPDLGWINSSAVSLIDMERLQLVNTILLDERDRGAANPWGVVWIGDPQRVWIAHAGTHEVTSLDIIEAMRKLACLPESPKVHPYRMRFSPYQRPAFRPASHAGEVANDLNFLDGLRERIPVAGTGPRAMVHVCGRIVTGNYFSESLTVIDCANPLQKTEIGLRPADLAAPPTPLDLDGERWFNDARLCFQGWQSCASCHDVDGRIDGLNWDLLNDGYGNPKNVKSLLAAHLTPPAMSLGARETAAVAVKAGLQKILFTNAPLQVAEAIEAFIHSLTPLPGPATSRGQNPTAAVVRGKAIFVNPEVGCAQCHPGPLYTDLRRYDVGTEGRNDREGEAFDTPTLVEIWRTAPYLHDGSAVSLREVLTTRNTEDLHGKTSHLSEAELEDLIEFLLTL